eukprot:gene12588-15812_t
MFQKLREGMEMHMDMMEQIGYMEASGQTERTTNITVDGVNFSIVDSMKGDDGPTTPPDDEITTSDGVKVAFVTKDEVLEGSVGRSGKGRDGVRAVEQTDPTGILEEDMEADFSAMGFNGDMEDGFEYGEGEVFDVDDYEVLE